MLTYVRELWWQRVDYYLNLAACQQPAAFAVRSEDDIVSFEVAVNRGRILRRMPRIDPESVRTQVDRSVVSRQMQFGIQFTIDEAVFEDADNRHVIEMAFGDQNGNVARLPIPDQIALIHSLVLNPTRPGTDTPVGLSYTNVSLEQLVDDICRMGSTSAMRAAAGRLANNALLQDQGFHRIRTQPAPVAPTLTGTDNRQCGAEPTPEPPRRGRRIEILPRDDREQADT